MSILDSIKNAYKQGNAVIKLIFINIAVFIFLNIAAVLFDLLHISSFSLLHYLAAPAELKLLLLRSWTIITYMFLHEGIMHLFFNMISLYWFGKIFTIYFSEKQLVGVYIFGGLVAVLFYVAAFNLIPFYHNVINNTVLLGASGSIMAIIVAASIKSPDLEMQLLLIGNVKLKYIAITVVLLSFFGITSSNGGGQLAHLGGALAGYIFIVSLRQGYDITTGFNRFLGKLVDFFGPRKLKVKPNKTQKKNYMSDAEFNMNKAKKMEQINHILDKIKSSGYESLSDEEKKKLFEQEK